MDASAQTSAQQSYTALFKSLQQTVNAKYFAGRWCLRHVVQRGDLTSNSHLLAFVQACMKLLWRLATTLFQEQLRIL